MADIDERFIGDRITQLRELKNISERKMSLDLGHSASYIHSIACGKALPSMSEFLYICEYLGVTPQEFLTKIVKILHHSKKRLIIFVVCMMKMPAFF